MKKWWLCTFLLLSCFAGSTPQIVADNCCCCCCCHSSDCCDSENNIIYNHGFWCSECKSEIEKIIPQPNITPDAECYCNDENSYCCYIYHCKCSDTYCCTVSCAPCFYNRSSKVYFHDQKVSKILQIVHLIDGKNGFASQLFDPMTVLEEIFFDEVLNLISENNTKKRDSDWDSLNKKKLASLIEKIACKDMDTGQKFLNALSTLQLRTDKFQDEAKQLLIEILEKLCCYNYIHNGIVDAVKEKNPEVYSIVQKIIQ